jgi:glycine C-acetyltransferase
MAADKLTFIDEELAGLRQQELLINIRTIGSAEGPWTVVDGKKVLNFCSNNYLGFANHPRLKEAAQKAIAQWGVGPAAVRTIAGTMQLHVDLEKRFAAFKKVEDCISLQSGYCANLAAITTLVGAEDVIFSDELNHASIIDGSRLSRAKIVRFPHCDADGLEKVIQAEPKTYRRAMLITDGVFSMDGDVAPLDKLYEVAKRHDLIFMVDDAHGEGVLGTGGRGAVDHFHLHGKIDIEVGTISKAFGVVGGAVTGSKRIVEYLRQRARVNLFSSAVTPADVAATIAAIDVLEESTELVDRMWSNAHYFKGEMKRLGFDIGSSTTPITPVMLGEAPLAKQFSKSLFENGLFAMSLGFPTVPRGKARIRVMISAGHAREDLDKALEAFAKVGREL